VPQEDDHVVPVEGPVEVRVAGLVDLDDLLPGVERRDRGRRERGDHGEELGVHGRLL
jgi:hypothetical protein